MKTLSSILLLSSLAAIATAQIPKDFDPILGPGDQKAVQDWAWKEKGFTIRLAFHVVQREGESAFKETEWRKKIDALVNGEKPKKADGRSSAAGIDKAQHSLRPGLNDYYYGTGISFVISEIRFLKVPRTALRDGSSWEYLKIANRYKREDSLNVYLTPTQIKDHRGSFAGTAFDVPRPGVLLNTVHPRPLSHETGHLLGLPHANRGVMWSIHAPHQTLKEPRVKHGVFTPAQIRKMHQTLKRNKRVWKKLGTARDEN